MGVVLRKAGGPGEDLMGGMGQGMGFLMVACAVQLPGPVPAPAPADVAFFRRIGAGFSFSLPCHGGSSRPQVLNDRETTGGKPLAYP